MLGLVSWHGKTSSQQGINIQEMAVHPNVLSATPRLGVISGVNFRFCFVFRLF